MEEFKFSESTEPGEIPAEDADIGMSASNTDEYRRDAKDPVKNGFSESNNLHSPLPESDKVVTSHMSGLADAADPHRDAHIPTFESVKKALAFLVAQNAQLRLGGSSAEQGPLPDGFHNRLQGILTNDICGTFAGHMQGIQRQTGSLSSTGVEGPLGSPVVADTEHTPKAPRAMLISERVRVLENMLLNQKKAVNGAESQNPTPPGLHTPSPAAPIPIPSLSADPRLDNTHTTVNTPASARPAAAEIAIPLDPQFLSAFKNTEREEGEISSSSITPAPTKGLGANSMKGNRATEESARSRRSRSTSSGPPKHRLPSSRTYRFSRSPEAKRRRRSPSRRTPPRFSHRSASPNHTKRAYSPDRRHNRRSPSPRDDRRYRRTPHSPTARPPRSSESKSTHSTSRRRNSEYDASPPKSSRYEPSRANTLPEVGSPSTRRHQRPDHERNISVETTTSDYRRSNHERRSRKERKTGAESPRRLPNQSISPTRNGVSHWFEDPEGGAMRTRTPTQDIIMKERTPTPSDVSMRELTPTMSRPAQEPGPIEGPSLPKQGSPVQISSHNVPGLWMVKSGLETVEILSCEFEIDKTMAERWGVRRLSRHGKEKEHDSLSLKLACVPLSDLEATQTKLGISAANPNEFANAVDRLETRWPPPGHLVIEVNADRDWGRSWLPRHLDEDQGAIEIIDHVHEGTNVIRFIQLAGLNDFTFLVVARVRPPDFYCLAPDSTIAINGGGEIEVDFLTSIQIAYS